MEISKEKKVPLKATFVVISATLARRAERAQKRKAEDETEKMSRRCSCE